MTTYRPTLAALDREPLYRHIERHPADTLRPGERIIGGQAYVYDADELLDWLAVCAKADAPDDLSGLSETELATLLYQAIRVSALSKGRDRELGGRVEAERARRVMVYTSARSEAA